MKPLDYAIVVPSRKRVHNMPHLLRLLPTGIICVDEREADDYAAAVPFPQLLLHPPMDGLPAVMNWIIATMTEPILVVVDDDLVGVQSNTGACRYITDADEILAIIENAARNCQDLGLTTFCFSRTPNTTIIRPDERPIVPTQVVASCRGVMGAARHRKYRTDMHGRADLDWTMQTLLEDRCIYADVRFYFDFGPIYSGRGGSVGLLTPEVFEASSRALKARWADCLSFKAPAWVKKRNVTAMGLRVSRTNKLAQR
jgi:hypothetical protein